MIDDLKPQDILFLKHIKNKTMDKFNLPIQCVCLEFMNDDYFRLIFAMKMFPFEVYFHRYEIIDNLYEEIVSLSNIFSSKKIHFMKVYVDHREQNKNLLQMV
jgi:hypothetical protein